MTSNGSTLILPSTPGTRERVCLITMPDAYDLDAHLKECAVADEAASHANRGRGEATYHSIITYPELRHVHDVTRVYVAQRNKVWAWHHADDVRKLELADLRGMHPLLANRMHAGDLYQWVASTPIIMPAKEIPSIVRPVHLRYGWLTRRMDLREISVVYPGSIEPGFAMGSEVIQWL